MHDYLSATFLCLLPVSVIAWIWQAIRCPSEYTLWERILYGPVYCLCRILWRVEIVGAVSLAETYPRGAVIVANHRCSLDPFFLQMAAGRRVHWMVAGEYFRNPIFGPVLRTLQAIPTNRTGADNASMKIAMRLASQGKFIGMFPEGRINRSNKPLQSIRPGAALVAAKAGSSLLPCWIEGAPRGWAVWSGFFMPARVRVFVGQAIPATSSDVDAVNHLVVQAMQSSLKLGGYPPDDVKLGGAKSRRRLHQL